MSCTVVRPAISSHRTASGFPSTSVATIAHDQIDADEYLQLAGSSPDDREHLNWEADELREALFDAPSGPVYPYVVATVSQQPDGTLAHFGCGPNLQGGVVTLCTCKHLMRSYSAFRPGQTVWVAGVTPGGTARQRTRHLFYLMKVGIRAVSQADMWRALPEDVRQAKSARQHLLGDLFEPLREDLDGPDRWNAASYHAPRPGHSHDGGTPPGWHRDIEAAYNGRRPMLIAGEPEFTWTWNRPLAKLREGAGRLPRNPTSSASIADFADRLVPDGSRW